MWKPGTAKPQDGSTDKTSRSSPEPQSENGHESEADRGSKKKLSGATMGMRFMQRKGARKATKDKELAEKSQHDRMELTNESETTGKDCSMNDNYRADDIHTTSLPAQIATATASDMYGLKADLIGRRSFAGFNESAEQNWNSALSTWEQKRSGDRAAKQHISDEELVRRYEDYVKGRGDMVDPRIEPIGGLNKKTKKRSSHSGEKRKR